MALSRIGLDFDMSYINLIVKETCYIFRPQPREFAELKYSDEGSCFFIILFSDFGNKLPDRSLSIALT